ncbi:hypothetical protein I6F36_11365 [Bradyrhizobium sp. BRP19]|uniref:hypothetical protein n=1 Tax=Bradyrhizobium sp. BRP19 TaxID=2793823 RepID=UPI001CD7947E|nr:hypothetical protein [Bradyrhizobium sp. BRP19]MCA1547414.1 hypothetical protein [Bradyrhizobium sp. BRP19]
MFVGARDYRRRFPRPDKPSTEMKMPPWFSRANVEATIDLWHRFKGRAMARNAAYLILAAVALEASMPQMLIQGAFKLAGIDLPVPDTPHWVSVSFVALAVVLLITDRWLPDIRSTAAPNPHDVELYAKFKDLFDDDVLYFLRTHDFGGGFPVRYFTVLNDISAVWVGSRYGFDDPDLAAIWNALFPKNRELLKLMAKYTTRTGSDWCQPYWHDEDWHSDKTMQRVKLMNDTGSELVDLIDKLEAEARKKRLSVQPKSSLKIESGHS